VKQGATGWLRLDLAEGICRLSMCHPPANQLTPPLCADLTATWAAAEADPAITAIVLDSGLADFSHGVPPGEAVAAVAALCCRIEAATKPVVVILRGAVLAEGVDLALAAHARVASADARFAVPAVTLGLVPGAGASQRLPRLIGAEQALRMLLTAEPVSAVEALAMGLLDHVVEDDPWPAARDLAQRMAGTLPRRTLDRRDGMRDALAYQQAVAAARSTLRPSPVEAPARIVDCVEAALLLPADQALAYEAALRVDLAATPVAAGLRHAAMAERRALRLPAGIEAEETASPLRLVIWGAGESAPDIALCALRSGMQVHLADPSRPVLVNALERIAVAQERALQAGALTQAALDDEWARLSPQLAPPRLPQGDVALILQDGAPEPHPNMAVLSLVTPLPAGAMALSLSGALSGVVAGGAGDLVEIAVSDHVAPARLAAALSFARRIGWRAVATRAETSEPEKSAAPVAVRLARAIAETVAHLERGGLDRAVIARALAAHGIAGEGAVVRPSPLEADIARRCFAAVANAGARLIESGVLHRPCEVDTVAIGAGLMARHTGGPMYQADRRGMLILVRDLRLWAAENPTLWQPAPLIEALWSQGLDFASLDAAPEALARALPRAFARAARAAGAEADGRDGAD
jgi:3-hydroxyacyl-CoA dehydrogenase